MPNMKVRGNTPEPPTFGSLKVGTIFYIQGTDSNIYLKMVWTALYPNNAVRIRDGSTYTFINSTRVVPLLAGSVLTIE